MLSLALLSVLLTAQSVTVVPLGDIDPVLAGLIARGISERLGLVPEVVSPLPLPESAFDRARGQYSSSLILSDLAGQNQGLGSAHSCRLAITEVDLFAPGQSFVVGQADIRDGVAVVSLSRLREEHHGRRANQRRLQERALKETIHEFGHTLGLPHCLNPGCVMRFSASLAETDRKTARFCDQCRARLPRGLRRGAPR
jgi:archaemetzincin